MSKEEEKALEVTIGLIARGSKPTSDEIKETAKIVLSIRDSRFPGSGTVTGTGATRMEALRDLLARLLGNENEHTKAYITVNPGLDWLK